MRTIVISLPRAKDRQNWIMNNLKIDFSFFWAIDGKKFDLKHQLLNSEAISTFISHITLMQQLKNYSEDYFLILEDDVELVGDVDSIDMKIKTLPEDWDIAFIGWYNSNFLEKPKNVNDDWVFFREFWGMHAYVVRKESIDKIYSLLVSVDTHIDVQLSRVISRGKLNAYFLKNPIFKQNGTFKSQIKV
jgi:GR25 family glycosyltransferase involved in LPS biosynthesis